jgi:UrcA family protein
MKMIIGTALAMLGVTQAFASNAADVPREIVRFGDLRQDSPEGLSRLYARLHSAAERVCAPLASGDKLSFRVKKCIQEAMERASAQIPALAGYDVRKHKVRNG